MSKTRNFVPPSPFTQATRKHGSGSVDAGGFALQWSSAVRTSNVPSSNRCETTKLSRFPPGATSEETTIFRWKRFDDEKAVDSGRTVVTSSPKHDSPGAQTKPSDSVSVATNGGVLAGTLYWRTENPVSNVGLVPRLTFWPGGDHATDWSGFGSRSVISVNAFVAGFAPCFVDP